MSRRDTVEGFFEPSPSGASPGAAKLLLATVVLLITVGLLALVSIGIGQKSPLHYPVRQLVFAVVAFVAGGICLALPFRFWPRMLPLLYPGTCLLLVITRLMGPNINGAHRWLKFGPVSFQTSEFAKLTALVWVAWWMSRNRRHAHEFVRGFLVPGVGLGFLCLLVFIGPDFGTTALLAGAGGLLLFIGGTRLGYLFLAALLGGGAFTVLVMQDPIRLNRVISFLEPQRYADNEAYQLMNSLHGFMQGGLFGVGFGQSLQKYSYLPEAHTDFILAIIAEETGLVGTLGVLILFLLYFASGLTIARNARDPFARLLALGITFLVTLQAAINVGVVTGSMPTKGLALPFISHGGSNLLFMVAMSGILLSIARGSGEPDSPLRATGDARIWM